MAVGAVGADGRCAGQAVGDELPVVPEIAPAGDAVRVRERRSPGVGVILLEFAGGQDAFAVGGFELEGEDAEAACNAVGAVEAKLNGVDPIGNAGRRERQGHFQSGESAADPSVAAARLGDLNCGVIQRHPRVLIHADAGHIGKSQAVDLHPEAANLDSLARGDIDEDGRLGSGFPDNFDRKRYRTPSGNGKQ